MLRNKISRFLLFLLAFLLLISVTGAEENSGAETVRFEGYLFPLDAEYISMDGITVTDYDAFESFLACFPRLRQVDMWETQIPAEQCHRLAARFPEMKWGWTMVLNGRDHQHLIRTDYTSWSTLHNNSSSQHTSEDFTILKYCWNLLALDVGHNAITDLTFLKDLPKLRVLILACNQISDISPLAELKDLEYAELFKNKIKDISPLAGLDHLLDLNICFNYIDDYSPLQNLKNLKRLWCYSSRVPNQSPSQNVVLFLKENLPDTQIDTTHYSTAGSWRMIRDNVRHPHYDAIVRMFGEDHLHPHYDYIPFEDSFPIAAEESAAMPAAVLPAVPVTPSPDPVSAQQTEYLLPIDFSTGSSPLSSGYTDGSYSDSTIQVSIESGVFENCQYWVADIHIKDASQLRTMSASETGTFDKPAQRDPSRLSERSNGVVVLNGDYYDSTERKARGFIVRQGMNIRNHLDEAGLPESRFMDVLLIDGNGDFHIVYQPIRDTVFVPPTNQTILNSFSFGPALVDGGKLVEDFQGADIWINMAANECKQRICLCQAGPLHYKVICCAGPYKGNTGMTVAQFARLAYAQDVQVAYNLDGGDSTWLYFNHTKVNDIGVNTNRKLMDIIYFASAE